MSGFRKSLYHTKWIGEVLYVKVPAELSRSNTEICYARLCFNKVFFYTFVGADKIDQIITERSRLNGSITRSVMVSGAGYLEEYGINKNLYIKTVNDFLNEFYLVEEQT